jgi:hypothetical protein
VKFERTPRPSGRGQAIGSASQPQDLGLADPAQFLVVALLEEDAAALDAEYARITDIA